MAANSAELSSRASAAVEGDLGGDEVSSGRLGQTDQGSLGKAEAVGLENGGPLDARFRGPTLRLHSRADGGADYGFGEADGVGGAAFLVQRANGDSLALFGLAGGEFGEFAPAVEEGAGVDVGFAFDGAVLELALGYGGAEAGAAGNQANGQQQGQEGRFHRSVPFSDALQFLAAFLQGRGIAVDADCQLERGVVLGVDDLGEGLGVHVVQLLVVCDDGLELFDQPPDRDGAEHQEQTKGGQEQPAVVHPGGVVDDTQKLGCVHVRHRNGV